jgi:hypothetical protein
MVVFLKGFLMRIVFFGFFALAILAFCGFSLYSQIIGLPGIGLPPPFSPPLPIDALWIGLALGLMIAVYALRGQIRFFGYYWSCACAIIGFFVTYTFSLAPYSVLASPESLESMTSLVKEGKLPIEQMPGYPFFLWDIHRFLGLHVLPPFQLAVELLAYFMAGHFLLRQNQIWKSLSPFILAFPFFFPPFIENAFWARPEALFLAGFTLGGAALAAGVKSLEIKDFLWCGLAFALAVTVKFIGIFLVIPIVLALRFLPWRAWWKPFFFAALPPLAIFSVIAWANLQKTGVALPQTSLGLDLFSYVSSFTPAASKESSGVEKEVKKAIDPIIRQRPQDDLPIQSPQHLEKYAQTTAREQQALLQALRPIGEANIPNPGERAKFFKNLALSSMMEHPFLYLNHVGAHFYCLWGMACRSLDMQVTTLPVDLRKKEAVENRVGGVVSQGGARMENDIFPGIPSAQISQAAQRQMDIRLLSKTLPSDFIRPYVKMSGSGFVLCAAGIFIILILMYLFSRKWAHIYAVPLVLSLIIITYFFSYALVAPCSDPRYSWVAMPLIFLFLLTVCKTFFRKDLGRKVASPPSESRVPLTPISTPGHENPTLKRLRLN